jgi:hypothetical protein
MLRKLAMIAALSIVAPASAQLPKAYNLKPVDIKEPIIWSSTCEGPNGFVLAFGGCDQNGEKPPRTRIKDGDKWKPLEFSDPGQAKLVADAQESVRRCREIAMIVRGAYLRDLSSLDVRERSKRIEELLNAIESAVAWNDQLRADMTHRFKNAKQKRSDHYWSAVRQIEASGRNLRVAGQYSSEKAFLRALSALDQAAIDAERAVATLDPEPQPRCLSPLAYDKKTGLFVLFGGDHLDCLTNDVWVFDPAKKEWQQRFPDNPPPPRANYQLSADGDGKVVVRGGYTYTSNTGYLSPQYRDVGDGDWTYDIAANTWTGTGKTAETTSARTYRTGPFHPDFFLQGPPPDAKITSDWLKKIPSNRWVELVAPQRPELCRTWGHAVFDAAGDQILVFSGGHSAHGGSDVLHFHLSTGRWELPFPVEFPLGQLYSNTEYPRGFNLNGRPWVTGHTYQSYQVDPVSRRMLFVGQPADCYIYLPQKGDWDGRIPRPKKMMYSDAFYTLQLVPSKTGLICWTGRGDLFQFDGETSQWSEIARTGEKLPSSVVDNSSFALDTKRNRLLLFRGEYGKPYSGEVVTVDLRTSDTKKLSPAGMKGLAAARFGAADHVVYDPANDLILFSEPLPGPAGAVRRSLAFDCANDRWMSFELGYEIGKDKRPSHPRGPGHSCGLIHDARRGILWGVNTHDCRVYALRLDPKTADPRPFE